MSHTRARIPLPTETLIAEHREILNLLRELDGLPAEDREHRAWIVRQVQRRLLAHFTLEEEVLYPAVWKTGRESALERIEEARWGHRVIRQVLSDLVAADPTTPNFMALVHLLQEDLEDYSRAEEENLFTEIRPMGPRTLRVLRDRLDERREQLGPD